MSAVRDMSDEELDAVVVELQREADSVASRQAALLAEWNTRKLWARDGSRSAAACYARKTGLSPDDSKHLLHRADRLRSMPLTAKQFANGSLSSSRVDLLARANKAKVRDQFERDEQTLLDAIKDLQFSDAKRAVDYWSAHADEAGHGDKGQKLLEERTAFGAKTFEGSYDRKALFDPVSGEIFSNEFERLDHELFQEDWAEAKLIHGDGVRVEHLRRTPAQRRCDALRLMAERSATLRSGKTKPKPLVTILVGEKKFANVCELASGTVLSPGEVVPWLSEADIERIVFDGPSRVLDLGEQRSFRGALRRVLEVLYPHCQFPGCDVPAKDCEGDHVLAYTNGGLTVQENGTMLCAAHNRWKGPGPP